MTAIQDLLRQLTELATRDAGPFPYEGCRWLRATAHECHDGFIPDLDVYLSELAGYRSWRARILRWPAEKIAPVEARLHQSFFERFPAYAAVESLVAAPEASDVRLSLQVADRTRSVLLQLFAAIREARAEGED